MEHDVGQQRRQDAALRNTFAGGHEQALVNVACFEKPPEQIDQAFVRNTPPDTFQKQLVVDRVEIARQISFDDPAAFRSGPVLQLQLHGTNCVVHTTFGPEAIGTAMKITLPNRFHDHEHSALDNAVSQGWDTQGSQLAVGFQDIDTLYRLRAIGPLQQVIAQLDQMIFQVPLQLLLVYSIDTRSGSTTRCQHNPGCLCKPFPISNES
jgi:hypothetical protein